MIKAKIKNFHSPDIKNLENFTPEESDNFGFLLQLLIGPENKEGEESFDVTICTLKWLATEYSDPEQIVFLRHHILVRKYDWGFLSNCLNTHVRNCSGANWNEVAEKIARIGRWEFEDYKA